jgi:hypothetical protein
MLTSAFGASIAVSMAADQISREPRQSIILILRPAIFDRHILVRDVSGFLEAKAEGRQGGRIKGGAAEEPDHRHRWLLRPCRKGPRRRAAEKRDELAPFHAINP